ncbi:MAG: formate dehydrogenase accessory protein FdhE [Syntrophobacteria bacterium]
MHADLDHLYQQMMDRLEQLRRERTEYKEILGFYAKVLSAQQEIQKETAAPEADLSEDRVRLKIGEGFSLFERERLPVDRETASRLFRNLCHLSLEENPVLAGAGRGLLEAMDSGRLDLHELISAALNEDTEPMERAAARLEVEPAVLRALVKLSLQPSLFAAAVRVAGRISLDQWLHGYCPVCGAPPAMAALVGEEGRRRVLCSFCGAMWHIPRLGCPFCATTKKEDLHYFYGEQEDLYRVDVCDCCRGYLKTIDCRKGGDAEALAVEDVATAHLDLLAEQEGYKRKAARLWGI